MTTGWVGKEYVAQLWRHEQTGTDIVPQCLWNVHALWDALGLWYIMCDILRFYKPLSLSSYVKVAYKWNAPIVITSLQGKQSWSTQIRLPWW